MEKLHVKPAGRESRSANRNTAEAGIFREKINSNHVLKRSQSLFSFDSMIEVETNIGLMFQACVCSSLIHSLNPAAERGGRGLDEANIPFSHHPISDQSPAGLGVTL